MTIAVTTRLTSALAPTSCPICIMRDWLPFLRTSWFWCWLFFPSLPIRIFNFWLWLQNRINSTLLLSIHELSLLEVVIWWLFHNNDGWVLWLLCVWVMTIRKCRVLALLVRQIALIQVMRLGCVWNIVMEVGTLFACAIQMIPTILNTRIILLHNMHSTEHCVRIVAKTFVAIAKISCRLLLRAHRNLRGRVSVEAQSLYLCFKLFSCWDFSSVSIQRLFDHLKPVKFSFFQMLFCFFLNLFISLSLGRSLRLDTGGLDICGWWDWVLPCCFCFWASMRRQTLSLRSQIAFALKRFAWFDWSYTWLF